MTSVTARGGSLAVAEGLASSARTIKELGLGNAVAITLDATLVRLILVPAAMKLLGDWAWWLPKSLDRSLPRTSLESAPGPAPAAS